MPLWCTDCDCVYFWSWYYMWTIRSTALKAGSVLLLAAFGLDVAALVSEYWLVGPEGYTGIFDTYISGSVGDPVPVPMVCPVLGVISAVLLFCDNILNLLFTTRRFHLVMPAVIVFSFISALMMMTVIVTWSVPDVTLGLHLSWSFVIATVAVVVDMAACGLCVMEFLSRRERIPRLAIGPRIIESDPESNPESIELQNMDTDSDSDQRERRRGSEESVELTDL